MDVSSLGNAECRRYFHELRVAITTGDDCPDTGDVIKLLLPRAASRRIAEVRLWGFDLVADLHDRAASGLPMVTALLMTGLRDQRDNPLNFL